MAKTRTSFTEGTPKPESSGRKKGTPNKITTIQEGLASCNFDFWESFDTDWQGLDEWQRMQVRKWLADFIYTKPVAQAPSQDPQSYSPEHTKVLAGYVGDKT